MPLQEHSDHHKSSRYNNQRLGTHILGTFYKGNGGEESVSGRNDKNRIFIQDGPTYESALTGMSQNEFKHSGGANLSAIFIPFQSRKEADEMPAFYKHIEDTPNSDGMTPALMEVLPFRWDKNRTSYIYDRWGTTSGDGLANLISDTEFRGDSDRFRDISNVRSIAFRLPMMAAGWGFTTDGLPWPSGEWGDFRTPKFKGGFDKHAGWMVDPADYIAAPIDLRYDRDHHVWTAPRGFWAKITGTSGVENVKGGIYSWSEMSVDPSGALIEKAGGRFGTFNTRPAYEVNKNEGVSSGTVVWMKTFDRTDLVVFDCGLTNEYAEDRFNYNKTGFRWDWNIEDWSPDNVRYLKGQLVQHKPSASQYVSLVDHNSSAATEPPNPAVWQPAATNGVRVKLPVYDRFGEMFSADFYFDSHGQLTRIVSPESSSSSSSSSFDSSSGSLSSSSVSSQSGQSVSSSSPCCDCITIRIGEDYHNVYYDGVAWINDTGWSITRDEVTGDFILKGPDHEYIDDGTWSCPQMDVSKWIVVHASSVLVDIFCCESSSSSRSSGQPGSGCDPDNDPVCWYKWTVLENCDNSFDEPVWDADCADAQNSPWGSNPLNTWINEGRNALGNACRWVYYTKSTHCCQSLGQCYSPPTYPGNPTPFGSCCDSSSSGSSGSTNCCPDGFVEKAVVVDTYCDNGDLVIVKETVCVKVC